MLLMFYHIVFLEVSKPYGIILNKLKIKKPACIGNISKNLELEPGIDKSRGSGNENFDFGTCLETLRNKEKF